MFNFFSLYLVSVIATNKTNTCKFMRKRRRSVFAISFFLSICNSGTSFNFKKIHSFSLYECFKTFLVIWIEEMLHNKSSKNLYTVFFCETEFHIVSESCIFICISCIIGQILLSILVTNDLCFTCHNETPRTVVGKSKYFLITLQPIITEEI